jgi:pentapeptide repeat protein
LPQPIVWITFGLAVLAALLLAIGIWWSWWRLPKREAARLALKIRDAKARADVEDNYRKTIGQALGSVVVLLGGVAALLGAGVAYLQLSQQQRASHDLLISNQVAKGFEQLGSEKLVVRLGGIYALEGVMNNSEEYYRPVLEALTAFVREGAKPPLPTTPPLPGLPTQGPPTDIQAALTVIGRRSSGLGLAIVDLDSTSLFNANLGGADLRGAYLTDVDLRGAYLSSADLTHANMRGINLTSAYLDGVKLTSAYMIGANLTAANLRAAIMTHANLRGAIMISANLRGANLTAADLTAANLDGQKQLDEACGLDVVGLPPGLTLKPCPPKSSP